MIVEATANEWDPSLLKAIEEASQNVGFDVFGVAEAHTDKNRKRFVEWIEAGRAGEMEWLKRRDAQGVLLRAAIPVALPWARSVIVCALNYHTDSLRSIDPAPPGSGWIGRYAWSGRTLEGEIVPTDYHDSLLAQLRTVEAELKLKADCQTRCYVDTGPLVERDAAVRAGIGWVGKNTCILNQGIGSWMLLGVIVTSLPIALQVPLQELATDRCGSCTRCIDACPTDALIAPRQMDASLCIAYLTIEKKGEIAEELRSAIGRQVFGCDICQEVCPWNIRIPAAREANRETRQELINPSLDQLARLDSVGFRRLFKGSPLERTGRKRLQRNVAIAMGNSGDLTFVPQLEKWAAEADAVLASTAIWALGQLRKPK